MRTFLLYFFTASVAAAQIVSVGVKAGVPVTQAINSYYSPDGIFDTGRWTVGPTIEFRLPLGFAVEVDALYRGYREQFSFVSDEFVSAGATTVPAIYVSSQSSTRIWDFPLLLKYRIGEGRFRPFEVAGYTFSHSSTDVTTFQSCVSSAAVCQASTPVYFEGTTHFSFTQRTGGPTVGLGVEYKSGRLKFAPEVRYTHLSNPTANVLTVMLGVTF
jgi:hypothetical protein